jgi:methionyl-tRNA formyltransferase
VGPVTVNGSAARVVLFTEVNSKFGMPFLEDLSLHPGITVVAVVTSPPGKLCNYYVGEPDPVDIAEYGRWLGVPVLRPRNVNDDQVVAALRSMAPDYLVIANYQQIFRDQLLDFPARAVVNFHPSPLPRYAGLAPFFWMTLAGERDSGVTALLTTRGIDDGPILAQRPVSFSGTETAGEVRDALFAESRKLLHDMIPRLVEGDLSGRPQDQRRRSYFSRPRPEDMTVEWSSPLEAILRVIRACSPQPGAAMSADGAVRILDARPVPGPPPRGGLGEITVDPDYGLVVGARDGRLQVTSLSWDPGAVNVPAGVLEQVRVAAALR